MGKNKHTDSGIVSEYYSNALDFITSHQRTIIRVGIAGVSLALLRRWFAGGKMRSDTRLDGKVAIVTGGNCGIGLETAKVLAARGATVVLACRDLGRAADAVECVKQASGSRMVTAELLDLASLQSVRDFVKRFEASHDRLDLLINNAGVLGMPESKTVDGFETHFGVNHLGHFLLTCLLLPLLKKTPQSRVVTVSSGFGYKLGKIHWDNLNLVGKYESHIAYSQSKLANVLFTKALAEKLMDDDVTAYSLNPGAVRTTLGRNYSPLFRYFIKSFWWLVFKSPEEGAQTTLHCALAPLSELENGGYYSDCSLTALTKSANSMEDARRLWEVSERLVGLKTDAGDN